MSDRHRSEDDNVEKDLVSSDDDGAGTADHPDPPSALIRPVSEPPPPGTPVPGRSTSPLPPPPAVAEWLSDWEDVRSDETVRGRPDPTGPPSPPEMSGVANGQQLGDEEPTEPNPAARIPSPPPVRPRSAPHVSQRRPIRASRPRPVSGTTSGGGSSSPVRVERSVVATDGGRVGVDTRAGQTSRTLRLGGLDVTVDATQRTMLITVALGMVVVAGLFASLLSGLGSQTETATRQPDLETVAEPAAPNLNVSASSPIAPSISELARSTVRIAGLDDSGQTVCAGSGVLVGEEGVILTNAHVVTADDDCPFTTIAVGVTLDTSDSPALRYRGEVLVVDDELDLAVVRIDGVLSSGAPLEINPGFPTADLGDSDEVDLGDSIRILGYPVIGGETITQTTGTVAGFVTEAAVGNRALMKTDASISAGNSGGMAVNEAGEVIGVPTRAGANELGPPVDCREVSDTNNDGLIDNNDACVPIGGFLNSIRPINLAQDLLAQAEEIQTEAGRASVEAEPLDFSEVSFWNPRFSTGEEDDSPVGEAVTLAEGVEEICLFVDWSGIPNGVPWAAVWSYNGSKIDDFSIFKIWEYDDSGRNFWYCAEDRRGHPAGVYEVGLFLNNELAFVESIEITEEPVDTFDVVWVNKSDQDVCGLAVNPLASSGHAGVNMLERGTAIRPDESTTTELPAGEIVVEAYDCTGAAIAAELDGLAIPESLFVDGEQVPLLIGGSAAGAESSETDG